MIDNHLPVSPPPPKADLRRLVIIGKNSLLWCRIRERVIALHPLTVAISHREIGSIQLTENDVVWIFSYALEKRANVTLMQSIRPTGGARVHYVSTATANITEAVKCYRYPAAKAIAELAASEILDASIVRIGMIYDRKEELPAGRSAVTALDDLVIALIGSLADGAARDPMRRLYQLVERPFSSPLEDQLYHAYGWLLQWAGRWPCLLRPIDILLRANGWRWYGYFRLSNERCTATI